MNCQSVRKSLSAHLDGLLSAEERQAVTAHARGCPACASRLDQLTQVRTALSRLPAAAPPPQLTIALRAIATEERVRAVNYRSPFRRLLDRIELCGENLMRPLAIPFAGGLTGGLVSAILLFSMLMPGISLSRETADVPVPFMFTGPTVKSQTPFGIDADFCAEVIVDGQGRMVNYSLLSGPSLSKNPELRRAIESSLLFTEFKPAKMFGLPTYGKLRIYFSRSEIDVKS
jgi:hypothetical protein